MLYLVAPQTIYLQLCSLSSRYPHRFVEVWDALTNNLSAMRCGEWSGPTTNQNEYWSWVRVPLTHMTIAFHNPSWFSLYLHAHFELTVQKVHMVVWTAIWLGQPGSGATDQQPFSQCYLAVSSLHSLRRPTGVLWNTNNLCYVHSHVNPAYQIGSRLLNCNLYVHYLEYFFMSSS